jgi:hypothetical protein
MENPPVPIGSPARTTTRSGVATARLDGLGRRAVLLAGPPITLGHLEPFDDAEEVAEPARDIAA